MRLEALHAPTFTVTNKTSIAAILLFLLTAALFLPALDCRFANLDDPDYVTENALVQQGLTADSVAAAFRTPVLGNWAPLVTLSYQLDWELFGGNPAGFHLSSLLWHAANAVLALALFRALGISNVTAFFLAALFAWHPLRVESVVWISERKDVLSGFFFLVVLLCHLRWLRSLENDAPAPRWYGLSLAFFLLGLMSKPMLVTTPGVLLLLDFLHRRRVRRDSIRMLLRTLRPAAFEKIPFLAASLLIGIVTIITQRNVGASAEAHRSLLDGLGNALAVIPAYLGKIVYPASLVPLYPLPIGTPVASVVLGALLLSGAGMVGFWQWRQRPWLFMGWLWFVGMLVPVAGLIQVGGQFTADRYTYLPVLGLLLALGHGYAEWEHRISPRLAMTTTVLACVTLLLLARATIRQTERWRDPVQLWKYTIAHTTQNPLAHLHLGNAYIEAGRLAEAERELRTAIDLAPAIPEIHTNLGVVLASTGRPAEALAAFKTAITLGAKSPKAQLNRIRILLSFGHRAEAATECRALLARWPGQPNALAMLAEAVSPIPTPSAPE